jgi:predicted ester cyclase
MAQDQTILHRWFEEVWNQRRESAIDEMMADNYIGHGLVGPDGKEVQGPAAFKPFFRHYCQAFPDLRITVEDALVDGDRIAVRLSVAGTHTGPGVAAAPTNKAASFSGMCIARIENGKIAEAWNSFDFLSMYQQLGMQLN